VVIVAAELQPVGGARRRLRHLPAVGPAEAATARRRLAPESRASTWFLPDPGAAGSLAAAGWLSLGKRPAWARTWAASSGTLSEGRMVLAPAAKIAASRRRSRSGRPRR
jgi:hypothetical protein